MYDQQVKLLSLCRNKPHKIAKVLFRVDGGANCQVGTKEKHFAYLIKRKITCRLGLGATTSFEGVGIQIVSLPSHPSTLFIVSPVYFSPQDDSATLSTGALKQSKLFKEVIEYCHE